MFIWKEPNSNEQFSAAFSIWAISSWWSQGVAWDGFAHRAVRVVWIEVCTLGGSCRTLKGTHHATMWSLPCTVTRAVIMLSPELLWVLRAQMCPCSVMLFWASPRKMSNLPVLPFERNSFRWRSKALIWQVAGVVLPKAGWEVIHLVFVAAAGVAWIWYRTPVHHCHSNNAVQNSLKYKSHCSLVDRWI